MSRGPLGYGRYDDDPKYVGCPRAKTDMTPCIARDGRTALADDGTCVGCSQEPLSLLVELEKAGFHCLLPIDPEVAADAVEKVVRLATESKP